MIVISGWVLFWLAGLGVLGWLIVTAEWEIS